MYGSQAWVDWLPYICLLFSGFSNVYHFACVWPTALKLGCITNFDMLFFVVGFISLVDEIQFVLIYSHHICIRCISSLFHITNIQHFKMMCFCFVLCILHPEMHVIYCCFFNSPIVVLEFTSSPSPLNIFIVHPNTTSSHHIFTQHSYIF